MSATNRGAVRNERDFYPTPLESFTPLLPYITGPVWEPACGDGRLVECMIHAGLECHGTDIHPLPGEDSVDFLQVGFPPIGHEPKCATIVTNPPFSMAMEFVEKSLSLAAETFMLLRLNFLGSQKRQAFWRKNEANALFVLSNRPSFTPDGKTDATEYAWFYWGDKHSGIYHP